MATKIECINDEHAICVDAMTTFKSARLGKAVMLDLEPIDSQIPKICEYAMGYISEDITSEDMEALYGKPTETQ